MLESDRGNYPEIHISDREGSNTKYGIYPIFPKFGESTEKMSCEESGFDYERCELIGRENSHLFAAICYKYNYKPTSFHVTTSVN